MSNTVCEKCGAPARPGVIVCEFCEQPISAAAAQNAITCRGCQTLNVQTAQQCTKCKSWLVVQCVFCSSTSPYTAQACVQCREPFAGSAERKAQRDSDAKRQQVMQTVGAVAPLAGSLLGGVAGAVLGNRFSQGSNTGGQIGNVLGDVLGGNQNPHHGQQYGHNQYAPQQQQWENQSRTSYEHGQQYGSKHGGADFDKASFANMQRDTFESNEYEGRGGRGGGGQPEWMTESRNEQPEWMSENESRNERGSRDEEPSFGGGMSIGEGESDEEDDEGNERGR